MSILAINYRQCPKCSSKQSVPILYGYPTYEAALEAEAGKLVLGGCCEEIDGPHYHCKDCEHEWNCSEAINAAYKKIRGIRATVGGYKDGYYTFDLNFETRELLWSYTNKTTEEQLKKKLRQTTINQFLGDLKMVDLLNWKKNDQTRNTVDGTTWSIEIVREGRTIKKQGYSGFPAEWNSFCNIIHTISGRRFSESKPFKRIADTV